MKRVKMILCLMCLIIILLVTGTKFYFSADFVLLSPYTGNYLEILRRNEPRRVTIQQQLRSENISDRIVLTEDVELIWKLIRDMKWTWVTSFERATSDEIYYWLFFEDNSGELIYPFYYYPQSDVIQFVGYENVFSINSSDILKKLLKDKNL